MNIGYVLIAWKGGDTCPLLLAGRLLVFLTFLVSSIVTTKDFDICTSSIPRVA